MKNKVNTNNKLISMFNDYFKDIFNKFIYETALEELKQVVEVENLEIDNIHLNKFVIYFKSMREKIETVMDYLRAITSPNYKKLGVIGKMINNGKLKSLRKTYQNMEKFKTEFMEQTGISLVNVEDYIYHENSQQIS